MLCSSVASALRDAAPVCIASDAVAVIVAKDAESNRQSNEHANKYSVAAFAATCADSVVQSIVCVEYRSRRLCFLCCQAFS